MASDGWVKLHRRITESSLWTKEPFTRGQAWVDMILLANHQPGYITTQGMRIDLERGELGWSEVRLAERWKWSREKVRRFFSELKMEGMIDVNIKNPAPEMCQKTRQATRQANVQSAYEKRDKRRSIITILNYSKYQSGKNNDETGDETGDETSEHTENETLTRRTRSKEVKKEKIKSVVTKPAVFSPPTINQVMDYCQERGNVVDAERWHDYYTANGWMVGKTKMKDWQAAVRTWEKNGYSNSNGSGKKTPKTFSQIKDDAVKQAMREWVEEGQG